MQLKSFGNITTSYQHIFLSPHFDDVVYSCGGTIGVQVSCGLRPLVMTIFAGIPSLNVELSPYAQQGQRSMGFGQDAASAVAARRQEDVTALDYLHADYLWLDYVDAIYRGTTATRSRNAGSSCLCKLALAEFAQQRFVRVNADTAPIATGGTALP